MIVGRWQTIGWAIVLLALLGPAACTARPTTVASEPRDPASITIECLVVYRSEDLGREETVRLSAGGRKQTLGLGNLVFHAGYWPGDVPSGKRGLWVWITIGEIEKALVSQLFQLHLREAVRNQFMEGHGFTDLSYRYYPTPGAESLYTCAA